MQSGPYYHVQSARYYAEKAERRAGWPTFVTSEHHRSMLTELAHRMDGRRSQ
jgi:hypothetical protein